MIREFFRGVIWPMGKITKKKTKKKPEKVNYRYVIIGMLVTDKPLEGVEGINQIVLNGTSAGLSDSLLSMKLNVCNAPLGDATNVLLSLDSLDQHIE